MIVVERSFAVTADPGAVLDYLRDFGNAGGWDVSGVRTSRVDSGPVAPGARWRHTRKFFGVTAELTYTLLAAEPGRLVFHGRSEGATCTDTVVVGAVPDGAEVTYRVELEMHGLAKLTTPIMKVEFEKLATESVAALTVVLDDLAAPDGVRRRRLATPPSRLGWPAEEVG